ncbi:hypothetical protein KBY83_13825 [Cyanobium sp. WKJ7-Wakatipu]|uniref:hypothetical protein n=1 Tax=Cyanobium sp. WKJ7-Wakatipu TaxID=2823726 RepID=UPI0020CE9AC3|nr:hypothetical protein [Cyanobium sp. WKJ7-Wakatipu]MCP9784375.1 hypothetical protein [Cyanobium sp. WKJ7-Wakatipu]
MPFKDSPEWDAFCRVNPLHMAACGKASEAVTTAWINQIVEWFHEGKAYFPRPHWARSSGAWGRADSKSGTGELAWAASMS